MDYTNDPDGGPGGASSTDPSNEHPNQHDYDQLASIYNHADGTTTVGMTVGQSAASENGNGEWGRLVRTTNGGRTALFELDLGDGNKKFTFVIWADRN